MLKKFFRCLSIALSVAVLICSLPGIALTASAENIATQGQMVVIRKIIYAVETGGQVYGNVRYDDFT